MPYIYRCLIISASKARMLPLRIWHATWHEIIYLLSCDWQMTDEDNSISYTAVTFRHEDYLDYGECSQWQTHRGNVMCYLPQGSVPDMILIFFLLIFYNTSEIPHPHKQVVQVVIRSLVYPGTMSILYWDLSIAYNAIQITVTAWVPCVCIYTFAASPSNLFKPTATPAAASVRCIPTSFFFSSRCILVL